MPSLFVSHGSPMIALDPREAGRLMQALGMHASATHGGLAKDTYAFEDAAA